MLGAIAGDIIGAPYERAPIKTTDFPLFGRFSHPTDDTVLSVALADSILSGREYVILLKEYFHGYPHAGYGGNFIDWAGSLSCRPYNSWGNGSAMRVSPVGFAYDTLEEVLEAAKQSAEVTHNHPEGIKGAQATATAIFLARSHQSKDEIRDYIEHTFAYHLSEPLHELREHYGFDVSCQGTVPPAIIAFLGSVDYEDAVRKAVSLGGDSDTLACITGGIAQAYYGGVPDAIGRETWNRLDEDLTRVVRTFCKRYGCG
jgi:ADP-ribosylglycohydrolase